jgi:hypothetical protein
MPSLVIEEGAGAGKTVPLQRALVLGREKADLVVSDVAASREHCKVFAQDGDWFVLDLNSRNGTQVNGERISRWHLAPGDTIVIGKTRIRFDAPELPPRAAPPRPAAPAAAPAPPPPAAPRGPSPVERERERLRNEAAGRRAAAVAPSPGAARPDDGSGIVIKETVLQYGRIADRGGLLRDDVAQRGGLFRVGLVILLCGFLVGVVWGVMRLIEKEVVETPDGPPDAPPDAPPAK